MVRTRHQTAIKQDQQNVCFPEQVTAVDLGQIFVRMLLCFVSRETLIEHLKGGD